MPLVSILTATRINTHCHNQYSALGSERGRPGARARAESKDGAACVHKKTGNRSYSQIHAVGSALEPLRLPIWSKKSCPQTTSLGL